MSYPKSSSRKSRWVFASAAIFSSSVGLTACGSPPPPAMESVTFLINVNAACGALGFQDIQVGSEIDISDSTGKIIGTSNLSHKTDLLGSCGYYADTFKVPKTQDGIYRAHVGNVFRGTSTGSVSGDKVFFALTLG